MERSFTNRKYLDALEKKVLVFDGAMGTSLQAQNLTAEHFGGEQYNGCNDYLVISYPASRGEGAPLLPRGRRGRASRPTPSAPTASR